MQPNDLPLVCLPLELSDESAAKLIEFLYELADALESHYAAQLMRYTRARSAPTPPTDSIDTPPTDPPS
ncbi:MAG: hypothetical protein ACREXP_06535 [Steroidobacteraceae bacterium]